MSGEISPTGKHPGPGSSPELRASHADRDRVVDVLRIAAGEGLLTADELDERLETALSARTLSELTTLTADLPPVSATVGATGAEAKDRVRIAQAHSGAVERVGRWAVPRRLELAVTFCKVTLDFTDAVITHDTLRIDVGMTGKTHTGHEAGHRGRYRRSAAGTAESSTARLQRIPTRRSPCEWSWSGGRPTAAWWCGPRVGRSGSGCCAGTRPLLKALDSITHERE
ncbi:DUF1707 domain-containing protein [Streptomyces sp. NPDC087538]|uniref:DUF1707 SHOCT-like domain-containing protein n=1 Tax=Streptomyces sp. NPDC087538 TaxID=3365797 RepID=UPI003826137A